MSKHWLYKADISYILNGDKPVKEKKMAVYHKLRKVPAFRKSEENMSVLEELKEVVNLHQFEEAMEIVFTVCDYNRVWLSQ